MSLDGTIRGVNEALVALTGHPREDLVGRALFRDLLSPGGQIFYETHIAPMLDLQGFVQEIAVEIVRADGARVSTLISAAVRPTADGRTDLVHMVLLDATERRTYEHELLVSHRRIERLQRISSRLASALDLQAVAEAAIDEVVDGAIADGAALLAYSTPMSTELTLFGFRADAPTLAEPWASLDVAEAPWLASALQSTSPLFVEGDDGHGLGVPPLLEAASRLAVLPLVIADSAVGLLCLASSEVREFPAEERTFLSALARSCAQAVDRAQLHQRVLDSAQPAAFLSSVSRALFDEPLSAVDRARLIVDMVVPEHADFATIELSDDESPPTAVRHVDGDLVEPLTELRRLARENADNAGSGARVRPSGGPILVSDVSDETLARLGLDDEELALVRRLDPGSFIGLPLLARGSEIGSMILGYSRSGRRFLETDLPFFVDLADRVALALENAQLYERERGIAFRLQMSLLPQPIRPDPRFNVTTRYRPASEALEIGGDWQDAFLVDGDRLGIAVGDVVGHDEAAALVMGRLSTALRAFALDGGGPALTLHRLSRFAGSIEGAECATVTYAELDLSGRVLTYACAGHMPPILQPPGEPSTPLWSGRSSALGIDPADVAAQATVPFPEGAAVLLFTDGLIERRDLPFDDSLSDLLAQLDRLPPLSMAGTTEFVLSKLVGEAPPDDDVCVVAVSLVDPS